MHFRDVGRGDGAVGDGSPLIGAVIVQGELEAAVDRRPAQPGIGVVDPVERAFLAALSPQRLGAPRFAGQFLLQRKRLAGRQVQHQVGQVVIDVDGKPLGQQAGVDEQVAIDLPNQGAVEGLAAPLDDDFALIQLQGKEPALVQEPPARAPSSRIDGNREIQHFDIVAQRKEQYAPPIQIGEHGIRKDERVQPHLENHLDELFVRGEFAGRGIVGCGGRCGGFRFRCLGRLLRSVGGRRGIFSVCKSDSGDRKKKGDSGGNKPIGSIEFESIFKKPPL